MKSFINKFLLLITFFMLTVLNAFALEPIKVNGLIFDNSDNLIFLDTKGTIDNSVTFSKGTLKEPDRIYLDINNAILNVLLVILLTFSSPPCALEFTILGSITVPIVVVIVRHIVINLYA